MKIPSAEHAFVDLAKLQNYALDPQHRVGGHKARLFAALLGLAQDNAEELRRILLDAVQTHEAELGDFDQHGQRYQVDFVLTWHGRHALIRSAWIVRTEEQFPRLVSCYPLQEEDNAR